jgi:hypothetical protein
MRPEKNIFGGIIEIYKKTAAFGLLQKAEIRAWASL